MEFRLRLSPTRSGLPHVATHSHHLLLISPGNPAGSGGQSLRWPGQRSRNAAIAYNAPLTVGFCCLARSRNPSAQSHPGHLR